MGLCQGTERQAQKPKTTGRTSPTHEEKASHDKSQNRQKERRKNLFESGQCSTTLSRHGQDGLLLPQTSHSTLIDQYHSSPDQSSSIMVQMKDPRSLESVDTMTAKQLLEMTQMWYKMHERHQLVSEQLARRVKEVQDLEGWCTALQLDNAQLRRQLGYDTVDYKGPLAQAMFRRDGGTQVDGHVDTDAGISPESKQQV